jgi:hypothetical protein
MQAQREGTPLFFDALNFEKSFAQDITSPNDLFFDIIGLTGMLHRVYSEANSLRNSVGSEGHSCR